MSSRIPSVALSRPVPTVIFTFVAAIFLSLLAAPLAAQVTPVIGLYWDEGYLQNETSTDSYPFIQDIYLVLKDAPEGVLGWELCPEIEGEGLFVGWSLEGQAINATRDPGCFTVGIAQPLPANPSGILLATGQVYVDDPRPVVFQLRPTYRPAIAGAMAYLPADDPNNPQVMVTATGDPDVAWLNADAPWLEADPRSMRFDGSPIGFANVQELTVTNVGGGVLELDVALSADCEGFSLPGVSGPISLAGGQSQVIEVALTPTEEITYECQVNLGENALYEIYLFGSGRQAVTSWSMPDQVAFGDVVVDYQRWRNVVITNTGETPIPVDASLSSSVSGLTITSGASPFVIPAGRTMDIGITFAPTEVLGFNVNLQLGSILPDVILTGNSRDAHTSWSITPETMIFTPTALGYTREASVQVRNTGDTPLSGNAALVGTPAGFEIFQGGGAFTIYAGQSRYVWIRFSPDQVSSYAATLDLGGNFQTVNVHGEGQLYDPACSVLPIFLNYGLVTIGNSGYKTFHVENPGNAPLSINPSVDSPHFSITPNPRTIQPGETAYYTVVYRPWSAGTHLATVDVGNGDCPGVMVTGQGKSDFKDCIVSPDTLRFGPVNLGNHASQLLYVENTGTRSLSLSPSFFGSNEYTITGGLNSIPPGVGINFLVTFTPQEAGTTTVELAMGDVCAPITCLGTAITGFGPYENLVGIFFDRDYIQTDVITEIPNQEVTGYLVLHNPSESSGVGAWELEVDITGEGSILGWELEGDYINIGDGNELIVGLGTPMMPDDRGAVLLATFRLLIHDPFPSEVTLQLRPIYHASIPGLMAWIPGHDQEMLLPMLPNTGIETVSWINNNALPATDIPAPMALVSGSVISLQWPVPEGFREGFHVYRRAPESEAKRITQLPVNDVGGVMRYSDQPEGIAPGSTLFYSYALIEGGIETARSPETEVTVGGVPALATRLLPNVPNPFNPMTRVRFELERSEQIKVSIFDLSGRHIRTLVDGTLGAGPHERVWDGRDDSGRQAPSGAYYVRLVTSTRVDHHKMMLLK